MGDVITTTGEMREDEAMNKQRRLITRLHRVLGEAITYSPTGAIASGALRLRRSAPGKSLRRS